MAQTISVQGTFQPTIRFRDIAPWAIFAALVACLAVYFVGLEQGAVSLMDGNSVHEFIHDGRHLLGFPCH